MSLFTEFSYELRCYGRVFFRHSRSAFSRSTVSRLYCRICKPNGTERIVIIKQQILSKATVINTTVTMIPIKHRKQQKNSLIVFLHIKFPVNITTSWSSDIVMITGNFTFENMIIEFLSFYMFNCCHHYASIKMTVFLHKLVVNSQSALIISKTATNRHKQSQTICIQCYYCAGTVINILVINHSELQLPLAATVDAILALQWTVQQGSMAYVVISMNHVIYV